MTVLNTEYWTSDERPGTTYGGITGNGSSAGQYDRAGGGPGSRLPAAPHLPTHKSPLQGPKLNKNQRDELLRRYRLRLEAAHKARKTRGLDDKWRRLIKLYAGRHFDNLLVENEDYITVNIAFSTINVIAPAVSVNHPKIAVNAQSEANSTQAIILENVVNYWWRHFEIKPQFKRAVKDFLILGFGWVKTGYRYVTEQVPCDDEDLMGHWSAQMGQVTDYLAQNPNMSQKDMPSQDDIEASIPDAKVETVVDRPYAVRISPFDIFVNAEATSMEDITFIAQRIVKTMNEVKADTRYDVKARNSLKPDSQSNPAWRDDADDRDLKNIKDDLQRVTIWEFYDLHNRTLSVFPEMGDDFLVRPMYQPYAFGHPFEMLRNYDVPDEFYPIGELEALEGLQLELDKTRSQMMNHRKRYAPKYMYDPNQFSEDAIGMMESEESNVMVPVNGGKPFEQIMAPVPQQQLPPEIYHMSQTIEGDLDRVSGVNEYQRGELPEIRRTATEANMIQDAANARAADKLAEIEDFIARIAKRLLQLAQQYMTEEQVARVIGKNGKPVWVPYNREDIQGEYDFNVEGGSTKPLNETGRSQQALQMLQAFAPYAQQGIIDVKPLLLHALQYGFGIKDAQSYFAQQAPPDEQENPAKAKLIESINYKDVPEDVKREIEMAAGLQPSHIGSAGAPGADPAALQAQLAQTQAVEGNKAAMQQQQHQHDAAMAAMQAHHNLLTGAQKGGVAAHQQVNDHAHEAALSAMEARHAVLQELVKGHAALAGQDATAGAKYKDEQAAQAAKPSKSTTPTKPPASMADEYLRRFGIK